MFKCVFLLGRPCFVKIPRSSLQFVFAQRGNSGDPQERGFAFWGYLSFSDFFSWVPCVGLPKALLACGIGIEFMRMFCFESRGMKTTAFVQIYVVSAFRPPTCPLGERYRSDHFERSQSTFGGFPF